MSRVARAAALAACVSYAVPVSGQIVLTLDGTIARVREQAGAVGVARARIAEAEAAVVEASARFRDNPVVEASAGPRAGSGARYTELDIGLSQQFETGGQRRARIAGAQAAVDRQRADAERTARAVVFDAASAFLDGIAAGERLRLAEEAAAVSADLLHTTERRFAAGDIAAIDVNLARIDVARSAATIGAARGDLATALGTLRTLLRLPPTESIELRGSLESPPLLPLDRLEASVAERPEIIALAADVREAEAQIQLGRALTRPDIGMRAGYEREEGDTIVMAGLTVTLPAFQQGRGTLAAGLARASRSRLEMETTRQSGLSQLRAAYAVLAQRTAVAESLAKDVTPSLADNEALGRRSYEAGEMNLMDLLLIRREALDTRTLIVDRRLDAARSGLDVAFLAGVLR
jgi:cobalt-zinc-cadmium efflux system outer membrane protein